MRILCVQGGVVARIRSIKPAFWTDEKINRLSNDAALFFIGLWNFADDYGFFPSTSSALALLMPRYRPQVIKHLLRSLEKEGLVRVSSRAGVGLVNGWEHQLIAKKRASKWKDREIEWDDDAPEPQKSTSGWDRIGKDGIGKDSSVEVQAPSPAPLVIVENPPDKKRKEKTPEQQAQAKQVREAYQESYQTRWGIKPTFAAAENTLVYTLIARVGLEEAVTLARAYPLAGDDWHTGQKHPFRFLVQQLDKIRVELHNPMTMLEHIRMKKQIREGVDQFDLELEKRKNQAELEREQNAKLLEGA
jgi:hypothetical protein